MSVTLTLGHHDFLCAVEGFARGSHLRQHVWEDIVYRNIDQMDDDFVDFLWFYLRRDVWDIYFGEYGNKSGACDFLQCMAALHRGNRWKVKFKGLSDNKTHLAICYRFDNDWKPLFLCNGVKGYSQLQSFRAYIPDECIKQTVKLEVPSNRHVEQGKEGWWEDLDVYEKGVND